MLVFFFQYIVSHSIQTHPVFPAHTLLSHAFSTHSQMPYSLINWTAEASPPAPVTASDDCSGCDKCLYPVHTFVWFSESAAMGVGAPRYNVDLGDGKCVSLYGTALHHCDIHPPASRKDYQCQGRFAEKPPTEPQTYIWNRKARKHLGCAYPPSPKND